ncbi:MAG: sugar phosphate nucleotidyltransferase [Candidatus Gracilibacteria bacterium]|jgi:mannose-1-phosphate guanylyltransferase
MKAVILAGGAGTRLWPLSTEEKPKQFHALTSNKTLLQEAANRLGFLKPQDIYIATNAKYLKYIREQLPKIPKKNIIIEPAMRDTATCIAFAATIISRDYPEEVMAIVYADHLVQDTKEFASKLKSAEALALRDHTLNIIEVKAREPNTNFGYVRIGSRKGTIKGNDYFEFEKFTEKPDLKTAEKYVAEVSYLWNTGYFVWRVKDILDRFAIHLPDTYKRMIKIQKAPGKVATEYPLCEKISIDYAIMEKLKPEEVQILPANLGWSDIGTWETLYKELAGGDTRKNVIKGDVNVLSSEGNLIYNYSDKKLNVLGMRGMVIVQTKDQTLVCPLKESQHVKTLCNS